MDRRTLLQFLSAAAAMPIAGALTTQAQTPASTGKDAVYELRVYHTYPGKFEDLLARFRNHTVSLFEKHGMRSVAYWTPLDDPLKGQTLYYILAHPSREAAIANWASFNADPEWIKVRNASEAHGEIVDKLDSTYLALTDFSPQV